MYVAVKGGERAIDEAHQLLAERRRGDTQHPELSVTQIAQQMELAVARVMSEGALYDPELAALALKQAMGDTVEAIFLIRAYRTTLPRFGFSRAIDTADMQIERRVSATYKDIPGGQLLGPTFDYTHRLLDFKLLAEADEGAVSHANNAAAPATEQQADIPRVLDLLAQEGLMRQPKDDGTECEPPDLTRQPLDFPADRRLRLQNLFRADEGFLLALAYSTQRGYGRTHPFAGEIRMGTVEVFCEVPELGFEICMGEITITECEMINQFEGNQHEPPQFTRGYGLAFGYCERKTMAMALVDRSLQARELGEPLDNPAALEEFVLAHSDSLEASGFVSHLKLPHYVDFQSELELIRRMRSAHEGKAPETHDTQKSHTEEAA